MSFRIHALPAGDFAHLHALSDTELAGHDARRVIADESPGYPCRVSLADAARGERLVLVNHVSLDAPTPYRASHAVFVREGAETVHPAPGEVPQALARRLLSLRGFDDGAMLLAGEVVEGTGLGQELEAMFADPRISEIHIHHARQGCYAARATRT